MPSTCCRSSSRRARWIGDGREYALDFDGIRLEIALTDESGKIDLNTADEVVLKSLFARTGGLPEDEAAALADAVLDWRDEDDLVRANGAERDDYRAAGLPYRPSNRAFATEEELLQVLGMSYELFRRIEPALTVHSGMGQPNPAAAPLEALMVYPGMTEELARAIIAQRQQAGPEMLGQAVAQLPDGTAVIAQVGGLTYSIRVRAVLPTGASREFHATIRLGMQARAGRPFHVLRFREGDI
ncbi:MAG: type II secretion system protein GspK [Xanthomonadales bacterium]|nr:type II secretion system protein GspK [Xanthomonadales bacterium]